MRDAVYRPVLTIYVENGKTKVEKIDYDMYGLGYVSGTFGVLEHIHTHPCLSNENIASQDDMNFASTRGTSGEIVGTDVRMFILNCNGKVEYNQTGSFKDASGNIKVSPTNCN